MINRIFVLSAVLMLLSACQTLTPTTIKTACDAIGGKHVYTAEQLKVLTHAQKVQAKTANDFWAAHCGNK